MLDSIINWVIALMEVIGSPGVGIAVFLENVFPPIPSEVILPLAGFTASLGAMNFWAAFIWSVLGSVVGAYLLYYVGAALGVERLRAIADWMWLVEPEDVDKAVTWFSRHGQWSILLGRLVPGVRSLISIPAGIDRMPPVRFGVLTTIGSGIWNFVLIALGFELGEQWEVVSHAIDRFSTVIYSAIAAAFAFCLGLLIRRRLKS